MSYKEGVCGCMPGTVPRVILEDYRTKPTLEAAILDYFKNKRKTDIRFVLSAYEFHDDAPDLCSQRLNRLKKSRGVQANRVIKEADDCLKKLKNLEAQKKPPVRITAYGSFFSYMGQLYSRKADALREGKKIEKMGHVCAMRVFGSKSAPKYALYASYQLLRPGDVNPYPITETSKDLLKKKTWWSLADLDKVI